MGSSYIYHSKKGWYSMIYIRLSRAQQANQMKTISNSQNTRLVVETWRFPICDLTRSQYGILPHWIESQFQMVVYYHTTVGQIWISKTSHGIIEQPWYLPRKDVIFNGWSWVCKNIYQWSINHYKVQLAGPLAPPGYHLSLTKRCRTKSQCQKVILWKRQIGISWILDYSSGYTAHI